MVRNGSNKNGTERGDGKSTKVFLTIKKIGKKHAQKMKMKKKDNERKGGNEKEKGRIEHDDHHQNNGWLSLIRGRIQQH